MEASGSAQGSTLSAAGGSALAQPGAPHRGALIRRRCRVHNLVTMNPRSSGAAEDEEAAMAPPCFGKSSQKLDGYMAITRNKMST